ncbi:MAG: hypothetical protein HND54_00275 [Bacteroidetes bacterium]|nr:hypothetical protein [Bacteroidota bacterium]
MKQDSTIDILNQKNKILTQAIDSLQIQNQLDKLIYKIENQNTIISEVNSFYDSAWLKLIFVITLLGIIVPIVVQYFQRKDLKELTDGIKDKFDSKLNNLKETNDLKVDLLIQKYEDRIERLENKNEKALVELDANTYYLQGRALFIEKNFMGSIGSSLKSALLLKQCDRTDRIVPILNNVLRAFKHLNQANFNKLDGYLKNNSENKTFEETLNELEKNLNSESMIYMKANELRTIFNKGKNGV